MIPKLQISTTPIHEVLIIESQIFGDNSSWFTESFNARDFAVATKLDIEFVQDNHSFAQQCVLRGMHYQFKHAQGKLISVISGSIFDVTVDLRMDSPTYGMWAGIELSAINRKRLWIPPGLAHGYFVLSESAECFYKTTDFYHPEDEIVLAWNDPQLNIKWPLPEDITPNMNLKDSAGLSWDAAPKF